MLSIDLDKAPSFKKLLKRAQAPLNLSSPGAITASRIRDYQCKAADLEYFFATQRVDNTVLAHLQCLADETDAVGQFKRMLNGEMINTIQGFESEDRQVLHTATRNIFDDLVHGNGKLKDSRSAVEATKEELAKLKTFIDEISNGEVVNEKGETFTDMILVGIGGSDLGPRAIYLALKAYAVEGRRVHFISNVDPDDAASVLQGLDLSRTLVNVISKSGGTLETLTNETLVATEFEKQGLNISKHFVCVTGKGSPLDNPAKYLRSFYMFDFIGGRFSSSSMVGAVMLSFSLGYDSFIEFLRGCRKIDLNALETDIRKNLPLLTALLGVWNRSFLDIDNIAVLPYSQALSRFAAHLQQCDMESNGKRVNRAGVPLSYPTGPIVLGEPGTNGQHAFYQLIHQSETVVACDFIGFRKSQYGKDLEVQGTSSQGKLVANLLAQSIGLARGSFNENPNKHFPGNRPNSLLIADKLTPDVMGQLLALYENKIAFQGFIWNINSFDQEGVQLGKVLANEIIGFLQGDCSEAGNLSHSFLKETGLL